MKRGWIVFDVEGRLVDLDQALAAVQAVLARAAAGHLGEEPRLEVQPPKIRCAFELGVPVDPHAFEERLRDELERPGLGVWLRWASLDWD